MADKPYAERTGGRYVRDAATGKTAKVAAPAPAAKPAGDAAPADPVQKKGK